MGSKKSTMSHLKTHPEQLPRSSLRLGCCRPPVSQSRVNTGTTVAHMYNNAYMRCRVQLAFTSLLQYKPMLIPPKPWRSARDGGHLMLSCNVVRTYGHMDTARMLQASDRVAASGMGAGMTKASPPAAPMHSAARLLDCNSVVLTHEVEHLLGLLLLEDDQPCSQVS